jgi:hypothetical protein
MLKLSANGSLLFIGHYLQLYYILFAISVTRGSIPTDL